MRFVALVRRPNAARRMQATRSGVCVNDRIKCLISRVDVAGERELELDVVER